MLAKSSKTRNGSVDPAAEHEGLLLHASKFLPRILEILFHDEKQLRENWLADVFERGWSADLESTIAQGRIPAKKQQALWREAMRHPVVPPFTEPTVKFGYSFFEAKRNSRAPGKRLGMVDLYVGWSPLKNSIQRSTRLWNTHGTGPLPILSSASDAFSPSTISMRLYALAFSGDVALGKVMERMEQARDWVRIDADRRNVCEAPLVAIVTRREIFDALSTNYDTLLLGSADDHDHDLRWTAQWFDKLEESGGSGF